MQSNLNHKFLADVSFEKYFHLQNGSVIKNLKELSEAIKNLDDSVFKHHTNKIKNDFASWIANVVGDDILSNDISDVYEKDEMLFFLNKRIGDLVSNKKSDNQYSEGFSAGPDVRFNVSFDSSLISPLFSDTFIFSEEEVTKNSNEIISVISAEEQAQVQQVVVEMPKTQDVQEQSTVQPSLLNQAQGVNQVVQPPTDNSQGASNVVQPPEQESQVISSEQNVQSTEVVEKKSESALDEGTENLNENKVNKEETKVDKPGENNQVMPADSKKDNVQPLSDTKIPLDSQKQSELAVDGHEQTKDVSDAKNSGTKEQIGEAKDSVADNSNANGAVNVPDEAVEKIKLITEALGGNTLPDEERKKLQLQGYEFKIKEKADLENTPRQSYADLSKIEKPVLVKAEQKVSPNPANDNISENNSTNVSLETNNDNEKEVSQNLVKEDTDKTRIENTESKDTSVDSSKNIELKYVTFGVKRIDKIFRKKVPSTCNIIFTGKLGTQKTRTSFEIANSMVKAEKLVLYLSFNEIEEKLKNKLKESYPELHGKIGKNFMVKYLDSFEETKQFDDSYRIGENPYTIDIIEEFRPEIVIVDSLSILELSYPDDKVSYRNYFGHMLRYFEQKGILSILLRELKDSDDVNNQFFENILADAVIHFRKQWFWIKHDVVKLFPSFKVVKK